MVDEVEISNVGGPKGVASEATLAALVKALNTGTNGTARAINLETMARQAFTKGLKVEGTLVGKAIGAVANAAGGLVSQLYSGSGRLSDFSDAVLGTNNILTKSFSAFAHFVDDNVDSLRELSAVGANFNNSIFDMRSAAASSAMSFSDFAELVKSNSATFARLGGSVSSGARAFGDFSKNVRTSRVGKELMGMGFTISSINEGLTTYLDMQLQSGRSINLRDRSLIKSSEDYLFQLDQLARLTGKQRDQLASEMAQLQQDAGVRRQLNSLDQDGRKNLQGTLTFLRSTMPGLSKGFEDIMDGVAQTDLGKAMMNQIPGLGPLMERAFAGELSEAEFLEEFQKFGPQIKSIQSQFSKEQLDAMRASGGVVGEIANMIDALTEANSVLGMNTEEIKKEADRRSKLTELFGSFEQTLVEARTAITDAFLKSPAFAALSDFGNDLLKLVNTDGTLDKFKGVVETMSETLFGETGLLTRAIRSVDGAVNGFIGDLNNGETFSQSVANMMSRLGNDIAYAWNEFWTGPIGTKISDTMTFYFERLMFMLMEALNNIPGISLMVDNQKLESDRIRLGLANEAETEKFLREQQQLVEDLRASIRADEDYNRWLSENSDGTLPDKTADIMMNTAELQNTEALIAEIKSLKQPVVPTAQSEIVIPQSGHRAIGTLRSTGLPAEPQNAITQIHQGERVLNPQETQVYNNQNEIQSKLVKKIEELNTSMLKAVDLLQDSVDATRQTARSIKSLGTDAMRGVGR